jgi:serine/threonine protein kinase
MATASQKQQPAVRFGTLEMQKGSGEIEQYDILTSEAAIMIDPSRALELEDSHFLEGSCYESIRFLGKGGYGLVNEIRNVKTKETYACKTLIKRFGEELKVAANRFQNEVNIMKSVTDHHHMVQIIESWVSRDGVTGIMFMRPIANHGSLEDYLDNIRTYPERQTQNDRRILEEAIGCLAQSLAWIHRVGRIRHKDVSPGNILLHNGAVIMTDFGISVDSTKPGASTTEGPAGNHNRRYSAPEVHLERPRGIKTDAFSLGCVMVEIGSVLWPNTISRPKPGTQYTTVNQGFLEKHSATFSTNLKQTTGHMAMEDWLCMITVKAIGKLLNDDPGERLDPLFLWDFILEWSSKPHWTPRSTDAGRFMALGCKSCYKKSIIYNGVSQYADAYRTSNRGWA